MSNCFSSGGCDTNAFLFLLLIMCCGCNGSSGMDDTFLLFCLLVLCMCNGGCGNNSNGPCR